MLFKKILLVSLIILALPCNICFAGPASTPEDTMRNFTIDYWSMKGNKLSQYFCKDDLDVAKSFKLQVDTQRAKTVDIYLRTRVAPTRKIAQEAVDATTVKIINEKYEILLNDGKNALINGETTLYIIQLDPNTGSKIPIGPKTDKGGGDGISLTMIGSKWYLCPSLNEKLHASYNSKKKVTESQTAKTDSKEKVAPNTDLQQSSVSSTTDSSNIDRKDAPVCDDDDLYKNIRQKIFMSQGDGHEWKLSNESIGTYYDVQSVNRDTGGLFTEKALYIRLLIPVNQVDDKCSKKQSTKKDTDSNDILKIDSVCKSKSYNVRTAFIDRIRYTLVDVRIIEKNKSDYVIITYSADYDKNGNLLARGKFSSADECTGSNQSILYGLIKSASFPVFKEKYLREKTKQ